jgi:hypothetical protein
MRGGDIEKIYQQIAHANQRCPGIAKATVSMRSLRHLRLIRTRIVGAIRMLVSMVAEMSGGLANFMFAILSDCGPGKLQRQQNQQTKSK